jgi:hypothetical protein
MLRGVFGVALAAMAVSTGCSDDTTTTPVTPTPTQVTDSFSGVLQKNDAQTFSFVVSSAGAVIATLKTLVPNLTVTVSDGGTGTFSVGEAVYQGASFDTATTSATVVAWNPDTHVISLRDLSGSGFTPGNPILGATSGASWTVGSVDTPAVGLALGTYSGVTCSVLLANDVSGPGSAINGVAQGQGTLCARVYDVGKMPVPPSFTLEITHY